MKIDSTTERPAPVTQTPPRVRIAPDHAATSALDAKAVNPKPAPADPAQVDAAIDAANQSMRKIATNIQFEKDASSGQIVVRVVDTETQQVLRQMPSEEMLAVGKALDRLQGLMVHHKV